MASVQNILRTGYNSYYADSGSGLLVFSMFMIGWVTGNLVSMVNKRLIRLLAGAGAWVMGEVVFYPCHSSIPHYLSRGPVMAACSVISLFAGTMVGGIAAWVDLP